MLQIFISVYEIGGSSESEVLEVGKGSEASKEVKVGNEGKAGNGSEVGSRSEVGRGRLKKQESFGKY